MPLLDEVEFPTPISNEVCDGIMLPGQGVRISVKCNMTREMSRKMFYFTKCKKHFTAQEILFTLYIKQSPVGVCMWGHKSSIGDSL